jgi:hypothetical protein
MSKTAIMKLSRNIFGYPVEALHVGREYGTKPKSNLADLRRGAAA